jgi:hypothetical protein
MNRITNICFIGAGYVEVHYGCRCLIRGDSKAINKLQAIGFKVQSIGM